jgi:hypothetical protein
MEQKEVTINELFGLVKEMRAEMATKDDVAKIYEVMATKDDLKNFATKDDFNKLDNKIESLASEFHVFADFVFENAATKDDVKYLNERIDRLATNEEQHYQELSGCFTMLDRESSEAKMKLSALDERTFQDTRALSSSIYNLTLRVDMLEENVEPRYQLA